MNSSGELNTKIKTCLPSMSSMRGLSTISDSCWMLFLWLGCDRETCPAPFTFDKSKPNSRVLCLICGSRLFANTELRWSSTLFSLLWSSFKMLEVSESSWKTINRFYHEVDRDALHGKPKYSEPCHVRSPLLYNHVLLYRVRYIVRWNDICL